MFLSSAHGKEHPVVRDVPLASKTNILDIHQCLNQRVHEAGGASARFVGDPEETFERRGSELRL